MIYLRITDNLQQMNQPFEHLAFRKLWGNVVKASTTAHLKWIPFLPCAVTLPAHLQCRELRKLFWTSTTSLNGREGYVQKMVTTFP